MTITEREIQHAFYGRNCQRYEFVVHNMYVNNSFSESDLFAVRPSGFCDEIEIKMTKSDFKADFNKTIKKNCKTIDKHFEIKNGNLLCNYFSFLVPDELLNELSIPDYAGVYVFSLRHGQAYVVEIKKPKRLHKNRISTKLKYNMLKKLHYRYWRN